MLPQFASTELNLLLELELSEGGYQSPEDVLLAGLKSLREGRRFNLQMARRLASLEAGRGISIESDDALAAFLDNIDAEVDAELQLQNGFEA